MPQHNQSSSSASKVGDTLREAGQKTGSKINELGDKVEELGERAGSKGDELVKKAEDYGDQAVQYIQKHPVKSVVFAGVAGIILGKIFKIFK